MDNLIFSIDPTYFYIYFGIFSTIGLAVGIIIYFMLKKLPPGKMKFGKIAPISNFWSQIAGFIATLLIIAYAYSDTWKYFYTASIKDDKFYLGYFLPERTVEISDIKNLSFFSEKDVIKGEKYRIKIKTSGQKEYVSQFMDEDLLKINLEKLRNSLNKKDV